MGDVIELKEDINYYFGVYNHKYVIQNHRLITYKFIVIKNREKEILRFTGFHKYISIGRDKTSVRIDANSGAKPYYICQLLNFLFVENYRKYKISKIEDINCDHLQDFMYDYSMNHEEDMQYPSESTVNACTSAILDFLDNYMKKHDNKRWKKQEFYHIVQYNNKKRENGAKKVPNFKVVYNGKPKTIFRDMPNSVFNLIMSYAASHYKQIFFLMSLSAFTGMRPSEACNVRQEISPLGAGLIIKKINNNVLSVEFDLQEEKQLRSDMVSVGNIKKERKQGVYRRFLSAFMKAYEIHKDYLAECMFEKDFCPMCVDSHGYAMTYDNYYRIFKQMIEELKPIMLNSPDPEISTYGHMLLENNISPHILRHWFSVRLTLYGEDVAGLQFWRGDSSPLSALTYLKNKGELAKQLEVINNEMFEFMLKESEKLNEK